MKHTFAIFALFFCLKSFGQKEYFQQEVNYTLTVKLDDQNHFLSGYETLIYTNNSPDALDKVYMHLWPNAYKNKNTALAKQLARDRNFVLYSTLKEDKGFIDSLDFKVNNEKVNWELDAQNIDIGILYLKQPLQPGQSITITTPFRVKLPSGSISRLGHIGQSYQITQWYPKPAVYDRNGWHAMPYLTQGEFYSEYGSFDVSITLPKNYVVGATGNLQTASEIAWLDELSQKAEPADSVSFGAEFPESSNEWKTIQYKQKNVHDFGWFADKRWIVRKGSVETPYTKTKVTTWAMYTPDNKRVWKNAIEYINDATYYYSKWNGDYPYTQVTAVDGTISAGGGMEYPNVTVIGNAGDTLQLETVIMHEVGHNWFYGILGSNERDNAWMDEGLNSFNEDRYLMTKYGSKSASINIGAKFLAKSFQLPSFDARNLSQLTYLLTAAYDIDQPLRCHSDDYLSINYGANVYKKTAVVFYYLQQYLGEELFDKCMQTYFSQWKFKHPQPADIKATFEKTTGQDLGWFFDEFIQGKGKADYTLLNVAKKHNVTKLDSGNKVDYFYQARVVNTGQTEGPCSVTIEYKNGKKETKWTNVLKPGHVGKVIFDINDYNNQTKPLVRINAEKSIPEMSLTNNTVRKGTFAPRFEKIDFQPFTGLANDQSTQIYWVPLLGWNNYDKFMAGVVFHNKTVFNRRWQWSITPLYSFHQNDISGMAKASLRLGKFTLGANAKQFYFADLTENLNGTDVYFHSKYQTVKPFITFSTKGRPENYHNKFYFDVQLAGIVLKKNNATNITGSETQSSTIQDFAQTTIQTGRNFGLQHRVEYQMQWTGALENGKWDGDQRTTQMKYSYNYNRNNAKRTVDFILFNGVNNYRTLAAFNPEGATAETDFTFNNFYSGRTETEGALSRQIQDGHGMLYTPTGRRFDIRMISGQIRYRLPVKLPLSLYTTAMYGQQSNINFILSDSRIIDRNNYNSQWLFSSGVIIPIVKDVIEIYAPIVMSQELKDTRTQMGIKPYQYFMFKVNLAAMDPFKIVAKNLAR